MRRYRYDKFYVSAAGPKGGHVYKSGILQASAHLRHEQAGPQFKMEGSLVGGVPYVRIYAWEVIAPHALRREDRVRERVLYEGPISDVFAGPEIPTVPASGIGAQA